MIRRLQGGGRIAFSFVIALGAGALASAVAYTVQGGASVDTTTLVLLAAACTASGLLAVKIPGLRTVLSLSDSISYLVAIYFGPATAVLIASTEAFVGTVRHTRRPLSIVSSVAIIASSIGAASLAFGGVERALAQGTALDAGSRQALALAAMIVVHFLVNSWQVALLTSVSRRVPLLETWSGSYLWTFHNFLIAGIVAWLASSLIHQHGVTAVVVAGLVLATTYVVYKRYLLQLEQKAKSIDRLARTHASALEALAMAIDARGQSTLGHVRRVQAYSVALAELAGIDAAGTESLRTAALLHDIGRLGIPDHILNKPGPLTEIEMEKIRTYPHLGARILSGVGFEEPVQRAIHQHRENWDGSGYPDGLEGEAISLLARILSLADAADAMQSPRSYRPAMSSEEMLACLEREAGERYDPQLVRLFVDNFEQVERLEQRLERREWKDLGEIEASQRESASRYYETREVSAALGDISAARQEATALFELIGQVGRSLGLEETVQAILQNLLLVVTFEAGAVYRIDETEATMLLAGTIGDPGLRFPEALPLGAELVTRAFREAGPHVQELDLGLMTALSMDGPVKGKLAVVPLSTSEANTGVLLLCSREDEAFVADDCRLLGKLGPQLAAAVHNASRYESSLQGALTDALTGLPNLRYLEQEIGRRLADGGSGGSGHAVVVFDLDHFKQLNDTYGHETGDRALKSVASYLRKQLRDEDLICRWGGDEFIALLPSVGATEVCAVLARIQSEAEELPLFRRADEERSFSGLGISAGWAMFPVDGRTMVDLLRVADKRMYRDKAQRRSRREDTVLA